MCYEAEYRNRFVLLWRQERFWTVVDLSDRHEADEPFSACEDCVAQACSMQQKTPVDIHYLVLYGANHSSAAIEEAGDGAGQRLRAMLVAHHACCCAVPVAVLV